MIDVVEVPVGSDVQCPACGSRISSEMASTLITSASDRGAGLEPATSGARLPSAESEALPPVEPSKASPAGQVENPPHETQPQAKEIFGRFQLLQRLGGGNFGEVFRAYDPDLDRVVALKRPHRRAPPRNEKEAKRLAEEARRFKIEAQAAAQLKHPYIVGVYEVGEVEGRPYFTAEYVRGVDLAELIKAEKESGRLLPVRQIAQLCGQVADALHAAHQAGVVHRDLKPANILVGEDGLPRVMDFGMAKRESAAEFVVTQAGTVLGSPAYMSPEQWQDSSSVGRATDIWSLGVMLFELLTGEFPFRASRDFVRLKEQILNDDPPAPSKLNSQVPADLDTLCLKCLQRKPSDRFPTAADLADELQLFLQGKPIKSRPHPRWELAWKWCKRKPIIAGLSAAIALSLLIGTIVSTIFAFGEAKAARESKKQEGIAKENETKANNAAEHAREQSQVALDTLNSVIFDIQRGLEFVPGTGKIRRKLLNTAFERLKHVSEKFIAHEFVDHSTAACLSDLGDTFLLLGTGKVVDEASRDELGSVQIQDRTAVEMARDLYSRSHELLVAIAKGKPQIADVQVQRDLALTHGKLGDVQSRLGNTAQAFKAYQESLAIHLRLNYQNPQAQRELSSCHKDLGDVQLRMGRTADAVESFDKAMRIRRRLAESDPQNARGDQRRLSNLLDRFGNVLQRVGNTTQALESYNEALKISSTLAERDPKNAEAQRDLWVSLIKLCDIRLKLGETEQALEASQKALKISRQLVETDNHNAEAQRDLSVSCMEVGEVLLRLGETALALETFTEAQTIRRSLAEDDPQDATGQSSLSRSYTKVGDAQLQIGNTDQALEAYRDAQTISRRLAEADPQNAEAQSALSHSYEKHGDLHIRRGDIAQALEAYREYLSTSRQLVKIDPENTNNQRNLAVSLIKFGDVQHQLGNTDPAWESYEEALKISRQLAETDPQNTEIQRDLCGAYSRIGSVHLVLNELAKATEAFDSSLTISRRLAAVDPRNVQARRNLMVIHIQLGDAELRRSNYVVSIEHYHSAVTIAKKMNAENQLKDQTERELFAIQQRIVVVKEKLGDRHLQLGEIAQALESYQEILAINREVAEAQPLNAQAQRDLMIGHSKLGDGEWHRFDYDAAIEHYLQAMAVTKKMIEASLLKAQSIQDLLIIKQKVVEFKTAKLAVGSLDDILNAPQDIIPQLLAMRLRELSRKGLLLEVAVAADKLQELRPLSADNLYMAAYGHCRCVMILDAAPIGGVLNRVPQQRTKLTDEQQAERKKYLSRAITAIQAAITAGWNDFDQLETNDDFAPLRDLPEFQKLVKEIKAKSDK